MENLTVCVDGLKHFVPGPGGSATIAMTPPDTLVFQAQDTPWPSTSVAKTPQQKMTGHLRGFCNGLNTRINETNGTQHINYVTAIDAWPLLGIQFSDELLKKPELLNPSLRIMKVKQIPGPIMGRIKGLAGTAAISSLCISAGLALATGAMVEWHDSSTGPHHPVAADYLKYYLAAPVSMTASVVPLALGATFAVLGSWFTLQGDPYAKQAKEALRLLETNIAHQLSHTYVEPRSSRAR
jgi:hypothetical protein